MATSDLPEKHALARRLIRNCEAALSSAETSAANNGLGDAQLRDVDRRVAELKHVVASMEAITASAFNMPLKQRSEWKRKVSSCITVSSQIESSLLKLRMAQRRRAEEDAQRSALLSRSHLAGAQLQVSEASDARALGNARMARRGVEEMLDTAAQVLTRMGATRETLKKTQRKLFDLANSLGISDRILRLADRRNRGDAALVYGGMAVVTLLVFVILVWWK